MHDLLEFKEQRIVSLLNKVKELEQEKSKLETFLFELCDKDCPKEYKNVIKKEVFND